MTRTGTHTIIVDYSDFDCQTMIKQLVADRIHHYTTLYGEQCRQANEDSVTSSECILNKMSVEVVSFTNMANDDYKISVKPLKTVRGEFVKHALDNNLIVKAVPVIVQEPDGEYRVVKFKLLSIDEPRYRG